jgi:hypothetical protein
MDRTEVQKLAAKVTDPEHRQILKADLNPLA